MCHIHLNTIRGSKSHNQVERERPWATDPLAIWLVVIHWLTCVQYNTPISFTDSLSTSLSKSGWFSSKSPEQSTVTRTWINYSNVKTFVSQKKAVLDESRTGIRSKLSCIHKLLATDQLYPSEALQIKEKSTVNRSNLVETSLWQSLFIQDHLCIASSCYLLLVVFFTCLQSILAQNYRALKSARE